MKIRIRIVAIAMFGLLGSAFSAQASEVLFGADGSGHNPATQLYTIDTATGIATPVGAIGYAVTGLAWDSSTQTLYGGTTRFSPTAPTSLITIDINTGAGTLVGAYLAQLCNGFLIQSMADLAIDSTGQLFGFLEPCSDDLYTINKSTGAATLVGNSPESAASAIAFDSVDTLFFELLGNLEILDATTGLLVSVIGNDAVAGTVGMGMDFDGSDTLFAITKVGDGIGGARNLVTVDTSTGMATTIGATTGGMDALAFVEVDTDGDGVLDNDDYCADTVIPESVPTSGSLNPNHWALTDADTVFDTVTKGKGKGPGRSYTTTDTAGCSCEQIIDAQGLGDGHTMHGCSISAMDDWKLLVNP